MESAAMDPESNGLCALAGPRRASQDQSEREAWAWISSYLLIHPKKASAENKQLNSTAFLKS